MPAAGWPRPVRWVAGAAAFVLGFCTAIASIAVSGDWLGWCLGVVATAALMHALSPGFRLRGLASIGWVTAIVVVVLGRPEGDYAIATDARGLGLLGVAVLVVLHAAVTLPVRS